MHKMIITLGGLSDQWIIIAEVQIPSQEYAVLSVMVEVAL